MEGPRPAVSQLRGELGHLKRSQGAGVVRLLPGLLDQLTCKRLMVECIPSQSIVKLCRTPDTARALMTPHITKNRPAEEGSCTEITAAAVMRPPSEITAGVWL